MDEEEIKRLVDKFDKRLQRVFIAAVRELKSAPLVGLLERGQITEALEYVEAAAGKIATAAGRSLHQAARATANVMRRNLSVQVGFDETNFRAVRAVEQNNLRLIREVTNGQRDMIREVVRRGTTEGLNPREVARQIRDNIGLTARQESFVANYERELRAVGTDERIGAVRTRRLRDRRSDSLISRHIRDNQPISDDQIRSLVDRYRNRWIKYRAEVIARTEGLRAAHEGSEVMYQQAIDDGTLQSTQIVRTWITAKDERVRSSHAVLNGQRRNYGEPWGVLRYPGDPSAPAAETVQCRCVLTTRFA